MLRVNLEYILHVYVMQFKFQTIIIEKEKVNIKYERDQLRLEYLVTNFILLIRKTVVNMTGVFIVRFISP